MAWRCALAMLCALQLLALQRAPRSWYPGRIELRLPVGASMVLGSDQLAAPQAARAHLELRRDGPRQWSVRALGQDTPVRVEWPDRTGRSGTLALVAGTRFALGGQHFVVSMASAGSVSSPRKMPVACVPPSRRGIALAAERTTSTLPRGASAACAAPPTVAANNRNIERSGDSLGIGKLPARSFPGWRHFEGY
jgi:hypothetical protein